MSRSTPFSSCRSSGAKMILCPAASAAPVLDRLLLRRGSDFLATRILITTCIIHGLVKVYYYLFIFCEVRIHTRRHRQVQHPVLDWCSDVILIKDVQKIQRGIAAFCWQVSPPLVCAPPELYQESDGTVTLYVAGLDKQLSVLDPDYSLKINVSILY